MLPTWLPDTVTTDLERALNYTLLWGLEGIELRTLGKARERVPNVNEEKVRRRVREADVDVVSVVPGLFEADIDDRPLWLNDLALLPDVVAFARRLECPHVVVSAFQNHGEATDRALERAAETLRRAGGMAEKQGIDLVVVNEPGSLAPTGRALDRLLALVDAPAVRAGWDPAVGLIGGEAPADVPASLYARLAIVRVRDLTRTDEGWIDVPPGEGELGWPSLVVDLAREGFEGPLSLELRVEPAVRVGLRAGTDLVRWMRAARRETRHAG